MRKLTAFWMDVWALFPIAFTLGLVAFPNGSPYALIGILAGAYALGLTFRGLLIRRSRLPAPPKRDVRIP